MSINPKWAVVASIQSYSREALKYSLTFQAKGFDCYFNGQSSGSFDHSLSIEGKIPIEFRLSA
jgi:hypothetical protein